MRGESGQASVEWVGAVLLVALAVAALGRVGSEADGREIATAGLRATACAVGGAACDGPRAGGAGRSAAGSATGQRAVTVPPLVAPPRAGEAERKRPARRPDLARARARAGVLWRRAWLACFAYERTRYALLHPETRSRLTVPVRGALQMVNDCMSPFDFARDWEHLRPR